MRNLIEFLAKSYHWFLFIFFEVVSLVLLFRFNSYQGSVWVTTANTATGTVLSGVSAVESYFSLGEVNRRLTQHNLYLEQCVQQLTQKLKRQGIADSLVTDSVPEGYRLIPAKVVDNSIDQAENFITIDKGTTDGVQTDMGVICGTGVVGIVYLVSTHYAVVIPILNSKSNFSCAIKNRNYFGYLHWSKPPSDIAYVDDIPRHAHFKLHEKVVTSGYSAVFPPGIMVGEILHVFNSRDGLSYRLQLRLSTDFSSLRDVCVLDNRALQERMELLQLAQDSIQQKN